MAGDDVYALQGRLLDLGFTRRPGRRLLRPRDRGRRARVPAQLRHPARRHLRPGHAQGAGPARARWSAAARPTRCAPRSGSARPVPTSAARSWSSTSAAAHNLPAEHAEASDAILHDLAARIEGRLVATGVQAFLTTPRWAARPREETERAAFANRAGADLFLSLALDASANPDACGVSAYFFGDADPDTWSSAGERFAGLVQREIVARSDLVDLRCHPKTWDLLRRTRMPAVRLDAGYLHQRRRRAAARATRRSATCWPRRSWSRCSGSTSPPTSTPPPACSTSASCATAS